MPTSTPASTLHHGDNLLTLATLPDRSVDLVATDPPGLDGFTAGANPTPGEHPLTTLAFTTHGGHLRDYLQSMLAVMREIDRVRKPRSLVTWHCGTNVSHWLRVLGDTVFGGDRFRGEVTWRRRPQPATKFFSENVDSILWWGEREVDLDALREPLNNQQCETFDQDDNDGRGPYRLDTLMLGTPSYQQRQPDDPASRPWRDHDPTVHRMRWCLPTSLPAWFARDATWDTSTIQQRLDAMDAAGLIVHPTRIGTLPKWKNHLLNARGSDRTTLWDDMHPVEGMECLGYPAQKPVSLYRRIIIAASNPGDLVLDPFCGSGTTLEAAASLDRRWIGIDSREEAIATARHRLGQDGSASAVVEHREAT